MLYLRRSTMLLLQMLQPDEGSMALGRILGVLPKPQASTGFCCYVWSSMAVILLKVYDLCHCLNGKTHFSGFFFFYVASSAVILFSWQQHVLSLSGDLQAKKQKGHNSLLFSLLIQEEEQ